MLKPGFRSSKKLLAQANAARDRKDWDTAASYYSGYVETFVGRRKAAIWIQLGHALKESGQLIKALAAYNQAIALAPKMGEARLQLGHLLKIMGDSGAALAAYESAQHLEQGLADVQHEIEALKARHNKDRVSIEEEGGLYRYSPDGLRFSDYREKIESTHLFDVEWYLRTYPDVASSKSDPLTHYILYGRHELRNPGPGFNAAWYFEEYMLSEKNEDPLLHYVDIGRKRGLATCPIDVFVDWRRRYHQITDEDMDFIESGPAWISSPAHYTVFCVFQGAEAQTRAFIVSLFSDAGFQPKLYIVCESLFDITEAFQKEIVRTGGEIILPAMIAATIATQFPTALIFLVRDSVRIDTRAVRILPYYVDNERPFFAYADHEVVNLKSGKSEPYFFPIFPRSFLVS